MGNSAIRAYKYTPEDVKCEYCTEYRKRRCGAAHGCPWLAERVEAGVVGYKEAVTETFSYHTLFSYRLNSAILRFNGSLWRDSDYDILLHDLPHDRDRLEELLELITETVCSTKRTIRVSGNDFPAEVIRSRFLKLNAEHIRFVLDCLKENTTKVRNIKQYLLATLFNAPTTIDSYYSALVNHDLYGDKK